MKIYKLLITLALCHFTQWSNGQILEDFESETAGALAFEENGQVFVLSTPGTEEYNIFTDGYNPGSGITDDCQGCGWNGTTTDDIFVDNSGTDDGLNNGTGFTISTLNGEHVLVKSFYLFCSDGSLQPHSDSVLVNGLRDGNIEFSFYKSSGFADVVSFTPNNGFTLIDLAVDGPQDYSNIPVDEITLSAQGDLDYMALDGFTWDVAPVGILPVEPIIAKAFPNPCSEFVQFDNIDQNADYQIYDQVGSMVLSGKLNATKSISLSQIESGVYTISFNKQIQSRFIKL